MADSQIKITADTAQAELSLHSLGEAVKTVDEKFFGLHEAIGTLGAALSVGLLTEMIKGSIEAADSMGKMAQKAGISVESLSQLSVAAKLADVDTQSLASGLGKLSKSMVAAQDDTSEAAKAYQALGISVTDSSGKLKSADDVLKEIAEKFANANDGAGKTAIAMALFGKSGAELIPMLNGGSEELKKFAELSDQLGLTLDGKTSKSAQEVKDRFEIMGLAAKGVGMTVMREMLPTFEQISEVMVDAATDTDSLSRKADYLGGALKVLVSVGMGLVLSFEGIGKSLGAVAAMAVAVAQGDFKLAAQINADANADAQADLEKFTKSMDKLWSEHAAKIASAKQEGDKGKTDINFGGGKNGNGLDAQVLALQNEEFQKYHQLMGVMPEQIKVYQLVQQGATAAQLAAAQAAADASMKYDEQLKLLKQEAEAAKVTERSTYELNRAREVTLASMIELDLREKLRTADMLIGVEREREVSNIKLQITQNGLRRQYELQVAAIDERMRKDKQAHALTLELESQYLAQKALLQANFTAQMQDAASAAAQERLKNEQSVANISANIRQGDYGNAMQLAEMMTAGLATKSQAAFELNKIASMATTTIKGYAAVMNAYEDGTKWGGVWGGAAEAAVAALFVGAQLQAISSTQFGGGTSISAAPGGVPSLATSVASPIDGIQAQPSPVAAAAAPRQQISVVLNGDTFSYDLVVNQLIPLFNEAGANGVDIVVNRGN